MASLVYSPAIRVRIFSSVNNTILDVSEDIAQWTLTRRVNAVSSFDFTLQNAQRKYDAAFRPGDQIVVDLKRIQWVQVFTGTLNTAPLFSAWPRALPMSASCSLKKIQFWPWDPTTSAAQALLTQFFGSTPTSNSVEGDGGLSKLGTEILAQVTGWNRQRIHFGQVPNNWLSFAGDIEKEISQASSMQQVLGAGATVAGASASSGVTLPEGIYGNSQIQRSLTSAQLAIAVQIVSVGLAMPWIDPMRACVIAIITGIVESSLENLTGGDRDSVGVFQQRPSQGWGTVAECEDVAHAATSFYQHLSRVPNWNKISQGAAAQAVQISAAPDKYQVQVPVATDIYNKIIATAKVPPAAPGAAPRSPFPSTPPILEQVGPGTANPPPNTGPVKATGDQLAKVANDLIASRPAGAIRYQAGGDDNDKTANPTVLDCSSLVDWVYYHTTGIEMFPGGRGVVKTQYDKSIPIDVNSAFAIRGAGLCVDPEQSPNGEHIGISLGTKDANTGKWLHVAAHTDEVPLPQQVDISPVDSSGFTNGCLFPGIDYTNAASTPAAATALQVALKNGKIKASPTNLAATSDPSTGATSTNDPFSQLVTVLANPPVTSGDVFGGARMFMNNQPLFPWLANIVNSSMRSFCSAPNGDFIAWFPDYFGFWGTAGSINIEPIELMDFTVMWSDQQAVTHEYVIGSYAPTLDSTSGGIAEGADPTSISAQAQMIGTFGVATMDFPQIFKAIYKKEASQKFIDDYLSRFGARPNMDQMANIQHGPQEFFMALWNFMYYWASQFQTDIPLTFMPEVWPGMLLKIKEMDFQCYVQEVQHTGSYGQGAGFRTTVTVIAPARTSTATDTFGILPLGGPNK